jgi:multidrug resistance efflux pump
MDDLFREQAVKARSAPVGEVGFLDVVPRWSRGAFLLALVFTVASVCSVVFLRTEHVGRARGMLRVSGGTRVLLARTQGVVIDVAVHPGDLVKQGQHLAVIDNSATQVALSAAESDVRALDNQLAHLRGARAAIYQERRRSLTDGLALLSKRRASAARTVTRLQQRLATFERLHDGGLASELELGTPKEELAQAERLYLESGEALAGARLQIANLDGQLDEETQKLEEQLVKAREHREALARASLETIVVAPVDGRIDTVLARVGDSISVGASVTRLIPADAPLQVVAFIPERDRTFVRPDATFRVEFDQLPAGEFGYRQAKVTHLGDDLASDAEFKEVMGEMPSAHSPLYRVEMVLTDAPRDRGSIAARPGSLLTATTVLRRQRLVSLLFEPLRKFLHEGS